MTTPSTTVRIGYIDAIKGFTILWVVIFHLGDIVPHWLAVPYRMPLFFFMSGIFFRCRPFKEFLVRRVNTLLIPLAIWLVISWLYIVFKYEFTSQFVTINIDYSGPTWGIGANVLQLFNTHIYSRNDVFLLNGPLWFLLGLFNVQMIFYGLKRLTNKTWLILALSAILYIVGRVMDLYGINGIVLASVSFQFVLYYALGSIFGNKLIEFIKNRLNIRLLLGICLPILILLPFVEVNLRGYNTVSMIIRTICFIPIVFIFFSNFYNLKIFKPLIFFGRNSLVVLATHVLIFNVMNSFFIKVLGVFGSAEQMQQSLYYGGVLFVVVCVVDYFVIKFFNRYAPWAVGKAGVIKY